MSKCNEFLYTSEIRNLAANARSADSVETLAGICKNMNIADTICLGKMDLWLAKHALSAIFKTYKKYPRLRKLMDYFGTLNGFKMNSGVLIQRACFCEPVSSFALKTAMAGVTDMCLQSFRNNGLAAAFLMGGGRALISGIIVNGKSFNQKSILGNLEYSERIGFSPQGCRTVKSAIEHEIGHLLDYMLGISRCPDYKKFIKNYSVDAIGSGLSGYSVATGKADDREVVAEAYSEFCNNPVPREIATFVGGLINTKYEVRYGR